MNKENLIVMFENAIGTEDIIYISVRIRLLDGVEVITFGRDMFESKLEYYKKSYDEELRLNTFNDIYIEAMDYGNDIKRVC